MPRFDNLVDAVTLLKRQDGSHVVPIRQYYIDRVAKLGPRYAVSTPSPQGAKGVCPLHDDLGPSFGIVLSRDGRERFNCFGCQSFGHVVDLHRKIEAKFYSRQMSNNDAAKDLLQFYSIDLAPFLEICGQGTVRTSSERDLKAAIREAGMSEIESSYTVTDYNNDFINGILENKPVAYFNTLVHKITYLASADTAGGEL